MCPQTSCWWCFQGIRIGEIEPDLGCTVGCLVGLPTLPPQHTQHLCNVVRVCFFGSQGTNKCSNSYTPKCWTYQCKAFDSSWVSLSRFHMRSNRCSLSRSFCCYCSIAILPLLVQLLLLVVVLLVPLLCCCAFACGKFPIKCFNFRTTSGHSYMDAHCVFVRKFESAPIHCEKRYLCKPIWWCRAPFLRFSTFAHTHTYRSLAQKSQPYTHT